MLLEEESLESSPAPRTHATGAPIEISRGSVSASAVDSADIVREVCIHHASRVVLVDNHPSGEWLCGASVLDHIIVGRRRQNLFGFAKVGIAGDTPVGRTPKSMDGSVDATQGHS